MEGFAGKKVFLAGDKNGSSEALFGASVLGGVLKFLHSLSEIRLGLYECRVVGSILASVGVRADEEGEGEDEEQEHEEGISPERRRSTVRRRWVNLTDRILLYRGVGVLKFADFLAVVVFYFAELAEGVKDEMLEEEVEEGEFDGEEEEEEEEDDEGEDEEEDESVEQRGEDEQGEALDD